MQSFRLSLSGLHLARTLGRDLYVIGFLAHHGRYGYAGEEPVEIAAVAPDSLEGLLHAVGKPFLLLDLRGLPGDHWLRSPLPTSRYFYEPQVTDVPRLYDAVFFLDEMKPSTAIPQSSLVGRLRSSTSSEVSP